LSLLWAFFFTVPIITLGFSNLYISSRDDTVAICYSLFSQIIIYSLGNSLKKSKRLSPKLIKISRYRENFLAIFLSGLLLLIFFQVGLGNLHLKLVSLTQVYELRTNYQNFIVANHLPWMGYIFGWLGGVLGAFTLILGLEEKRRIMVGLSLAGLATCFLITGEKWVIAAVPFILLLKMLFKKSLSLDTGYFFKIMSLFVLFCGFIQSVVPKIGVFDLAVRRSLVDPSTMTLAYVKYSSHHPLNFWKDTNIVGHFLNQPKTGLSKLVGQSYFSSNTNATTGVLGDAIVQAGIFGVLVISIVVFAIFLSLQKIFLVSESRTLLIVSVLLMEIMAETSLQTLMVTKGFFILVLYYFWDLFQIIKSDKGLANLRRS
jgi:hypothetical protein